MTIDPRNIVRMDERLLRDYLRRLAQVAREHDAADLSDVVEKLSAISEGDIDLYRAEMERIGAEIPPGADY